MGTFFILALFFILGTFQHHALGTMHQDSLGVVRGGAPHILNVQIENGSSDDLINQQSYTSATKMSPWPPKMATAQDLKRAVDNFIGAGG